MYQDITTFVPFQHENSDSKNQFIAFARKQFQENPTAEGALAATVIYTNLVDYLVNHLLKNLRKMVSIDSYLKFGAIFYFDASKARKDLTLGDASVELKNFGFPDKEDFLNELNNFRQLRNSMTHDLMHVDLTTKPQELDKKIEKIRKSAEEILARYNAISSGIANAWNASRQK
jgi:uncharacterized protein with HEPN domain